MPVASIFKGVEERLLRALQLPCVGGQSADEFDTCLHKLPRRLKLMVEFFHSLIHALFKELTALLGQLHALLGEFHALLEAVHSLVGKFRSPFGAIHAFIESALRGFAVRGHPIEYHVNAVEFGLRFWVHNDSSISEEAPGIRPLNSGTMT